MTLTRQEMKFDVPELTLDMALRLLRSAFARQQLSEEDAIRLMEYHLKRNRQARKSHRKTWLRGTTTHSPKGEIEYHNYPLFLAIKTSRTARTAKQERASSTLRDPRRGHCTLNMKRWRAKVRISSYQARASHPLFTRKA